MNKDGFLHWLGTDAGKAAMAGALGGVVRWITLRERPRDAFGSLFAGSICAVYLGPLVVPIIEPVIGKIAPGGDAAGFASFIVGLGGISIASMLIEIFRARQKKAEENYDRMKNAAKREARVWVVVAVLAVIYLIVF